MQEYRIKAFGRFRNALGRDYRDYLRSLRRYATA